MEKKINLICPFCKNITPFEMDLLMTHEKLFCPECTKAYDIETWNTADDSWSEF